MEKRRRKNCWAESRKQEIKSRVTFTQVRISSFLRADEWSDLNLNFEFDKSQVFLMHISLDPSKSRPTVPSFAESTAGRLHRHQQLSFTKS